MSKYDVIAVGVGSMGASACWWLAKRGYKVLGIEQFSSPHTEGSHAGQSRIIRKAYFEHPDYVPLLNRAYQNWQLLESEAGEQLYFKTGLVYYGPSHHQIIKGVKGAAGLHGIKIESENSASALFSLPQDFETIYEPDAGFLRPEKSISVLKGQAIKYGAVINDKEKAIKWNRDKDCIRVITDKAEYVSKKLIVTTGAWASKLIPHVSGKIRITRQLIVWMKPKDEKVFSSKNFPCWLVADDKRPGALYGFPYLDEERFGSPAGFKFAWHHAADETDPDFVNRKITNEEIKQLVSEVTAYIPAVADMELVTAKTCLYANSPDDNFIIDHLPSTDTDVTIACGFSGHGFKFVSVVGEILADMAMHGKTELPVDFLKLKRFA